jgi:hypothetical protein
MGMPRLAFLSVAAVLAAAAPVRAEDHWRLDLHLHFHIPALAYAEFVGGMADLFFVGHDLYFAGTEQHMSTRMAAAELILSVPQAAGYFYQYGRNPEAGLLVMGIACSALALHGGLSLAIPGIEQPVRVMPAFVGKGTPGLGISGQF